MTAALPFETRFAAALRAPAPGDPPFPLDALARRLATSLRALEPRLLRNATSAEPLPASDAASRLCGEAFPRNWFKIRRGPVPPAAERLGGADRSPPRIASRSDCGFPPSRRSSFRGRAAAAAAALLCATALGAWSAGVFKPAPLHRRIPSISVRDATFPELLDAVRAELARLDPDPESAVSFLIELPEGRRVEDLPHVTIAAHNVTALALLDTAADMVGLESRREGNTVVFVPKPDDPPAPPEGAVVHYGNEWDRDPATRPAVLETREWTLPDGTASPPRPCTSLEWKAYLAAHGVDWPYGSSLAWSEALGVLRIENAPEQLARAEEIVDSFLHAEDEGGVSVE